MDQKLTVLDRVTLPTPRFFRKVRTIGAALAAVGSILATAPVALPAAVVALGGYLMLAGSVAAAVSSVAVDPDTAPVRADGRTPAEVRDIVERGDAASL
jgi:ABC-type xylose transport system permease subunit